MLFKCLYIHAYVMKQKICIYIFWVSKLIFHMFLYCSGFSQSFYRCSSNIYHNCLQQSFHPEDPKRETFTKMSGDVSLQSMIPHWPSRYFATSCMQIFCHGYLLKEFVEDIANWHSITHWKKNNSSGHITPNSLRILQRMYGKLPETSPEGICLMIQYIPLGFSCMFGMSLNKLLQGFCWVTYSGNIHEKIMEDFSQQILVKKLFGRYLPQ